MGASREWRDRAACRADDVDPETFFPVAERGPALDAAVAAARAVCARCPVRVECLADALARIPDGIAGGLTPAERRRLRPRRPARTRVPTDPEFAVTLTRPELTRAGRQLLAAGCSVPDTARRAGVTSRTADRWAALNRTAPRPT